MQKLTLLLIVLGAVALWILLSVIFYRAFFKRFYDILLSATAILILSPLLIVLIIVGAIKMGGNPFFIQERPGKKEKIFKLIKFRTMTSKTDSGGNLLPDEERLTKYGKFLRTTSLDELPELFNIFFGHMSIVGPRPLLVKYLPLYDKFQRERHKVRPGLTGLAQISGRNAISWEQKFVKDIEYISKITLLGDIKIIFKTVGKIFKREGISQDGNATMEEFKGIEHPQGLKEEKIVSKPNVLITSCGRRVELTQAFKKACELYGGKVVCADMSSTAPALFFADAMYSLPAIENEKFIPSIIEICKKEQIKLIIPTIDTELYKFSQNKEKIETECGAIVCVSSLNVIEICGNKNLTVDFLKANCCAVPHTFLKDELERGDETYPIFIKPKDGSSSVNAFKIRNKKELDFFMQYVPNPIVQECVSGKEYTVDVLCDFDSNILSIVPRERLATRGGEVLKGRIDKNEYIISETAKLIKALKPIGHITVQGFYCDDGVFRFIEINARFGGGAPMSFYAGADSTVSLIKLVNGEKLAYSAEYKDKAVYSRFDSCVLVEEGK